MAAKTTGREWKKFYADKEFWPEGVYHENEEVDVNGNIATLEAAFRRWLKKQNTVTLLVEVGKDKEEAVKSAIAKAGDKLVAGKR